MTPADKLLPLLDRVRRSGPHSWTARCPSHDDKGPSLSVKEADDGKLLVHCFAGCAVGEIVGAVGLDLADLFPPRPHAPGAGAPAMRRPWTAAELLRLAAFESSIVALIGADMAAGREVDRPRLLEAAARLGEIAEVAHAH